jgi:hypothetical protein
MKMASLLSRDHAALSAALCSESFREDFAKDPTSATASIGLQPIERDRALELADAHFASASRDRRFVEQLLVTACDSDFQATTGRETDASNIDC